MSKILDDLFYGEIIPNHWECNQELTQKAEDCENKLIEILKGEEKELFISYSSAQSSIIGETALENFKCGFKLGCRIITEVLTLNP